MVKGTEFCLKRFNSQIKTLKMKKLILYLTTTLLLLTIIPIQSKAESETTSVPKVTNSTAESAGTSKEDKAIMDRINEIKAMDFSRLSAAEKKELRKELRKDKDHFIHGRGVYLSVGAIIIIILLLILLL